MPLTVVARLKAKAGKEDALYEVLTGLLAPTRAEKGCVFYDMHKSADEPGLFMFTEEWETRPLWDDHMNSPHLTAFSAKQDDLVENWTLFTGEKV
ncbi:antibiotic biosynthesis monooxygenase [Defluviimonas sp. WL0002]|uniref:Antibiotic biosynthesis monooxygenase n=1 Tax=Albidovulum marisflavi TaxID=2984159 RepID=A0ABT2ZEX0_9RHOB|nr:putative quinol monooxygenase [Defluviimonas sp. WL0002]MCV2869693.1 antibiotic biosynthesis monooxygenase [Defluviimonas sp. WL0002]